MITDINIRKTLVHKFNFKGDEEELQLLESILEGKDLNEDLYETIKSFNIPFGCEGSFHDYEYTLKFYSSAVSGCGDSGPITVYAQEPTPSGFFSIKDAEEWVKDRVIKSLLINLNCYSEEVLHTNKLIQSIHDDEGLNNFKIK